MQGKNNKKGMRPGIAQRQAEAAQAAIQPVLTPEEIAERNRLAKILDGPGQVYGADGKILATGRVRNGPVRVGNTQVTLIESDDELICIPPGDIKMIVYEKALTPADVTPEVPAST